MLTRDEALNLITKHVSKRSTIYHMLAVEAIMRSLAKHLGEDDEVWGLVGLIHDIDYERTESTPERHGLLAEEMLKGAIPDELLRTVKAHNFKHTNVMPETRMDKALISCDAVSGLLIACALVMPSKKLADVRTETVVRKFKDKDFARGADRGKIAMCEDIGVPKEKLFEIALNGLKSVAADIGL